MRILGNFVLEPVIGVCVLMLYSYGNSSTSIVDCIPVVYECIQAFEVLGKVHLNCMSLWKVHVFLRVCMYIHCCTKMKFVRTYVADLSVLYCCVCNVLYYGYGNESIHILPLLLLLFWGIRCSLSRFWLSAFVYTVGVLFLGMRGPPTLSVLLFILYTWVWC